MEMLNIFIEIQCNTQIIQNPTVNNIILMEANQQVSPNEADTKKSDNSTISQLITQDLFLHITKQLRQSLNRSVNSYNPHGIKSFVWKCFSSAHSSLTDIQIHSIVVQIQKFFKQNKTKIEAQMSAIRYYHELIIGMQRFRPFISIVLPCLFVEVLENVKSENKFYFFRELKAIFRVWHGYMDLPFLRKVRDFCIASCQTNLNEIDYTDKYLCKEMQGIKCNKFTLQKIFGTINQQIFAKPPKPFFHQRSPPFKSKPKHRKTSQQRSKLQSSFQDANADATSTQVIHRSGQGDEEGEDGEGKKGKVEATLQTAKQKVPIKVSNDKANICNQNKLSDKLIKLKEMQALMLSKKKRRGNRFLVDGGVWQLCSDLMQASEKVSKKSIYRMIEQEGEEEDEQWIYPHDKINQQREAKPFQFACKFCNTKLQPTIHQNEEYLKDAVCFEMRRTGRRSKRAHLFRITSEEKCQEGLFLLHRECFEVVRKGNIDQTKWDLQ